MNLSLKVGESCQENRNSFKQT